MDKSIKTIVADTHTYTYRYMYKLDSSEHINVIVYTATQQGHNDFISHLKTQPGVLSCLREYVCEYDVSAFGYTETIVESSVVDSSSEV